MKKFAIVLILLSLASYSNAASIFDNIHEVDPGKLIRTAQLTPSALEQLVIDKKIKTIINLRGEEPGSSWFDGEAAVAQKYNILHVNIPMEPDRIPLREDLLKLLEAYKSAPRPILIHCLRGVDRTGEAAAIYQMIYQNKSKPEALKMLSAKYFYITEIMPAKYYFIDQVWQDEQWAYDQYKPCDGDYKYFDKSKLCK